MDSVPILLPPLGEGIREARVVARLKEEGESINRDDPLAEVETDKATLVIESPAAGVVEAWFVEVGETYPVGTFMTAILRNHPDSSPQSPKSSTSALRNRHISPRARSWCVSQGINPDDLTESLWGGERRLAIKDIERWQKDTLTSTNEPVRMTRLAPFATGTVECHASWDVLLEAANKSNSGTSALAAWCVMRAIERHPAFRLASGGPDLGVAVDLLRDGLSVGVIDDEALDDRHAFVAAFERAVSVARSRPNSLPSCATIFSDMSSFGIRSATPIVIPPTIATIFMGAPFDTPIPSPEGVAWIRETKLALAFNHDRINGAGAARFLQEIRRNIERLGT